MPVIAVGTGVLRVNSVQLPLADEMRIMALEEKREPLMGMDGSFAVQTEFVSPSIEAAVRYTKDVDFGKIFKGNGDTVTAEMSDGSSFTMSNAVFTGEGEHDVKDGKVSCKWNSQTMRRVI